MRTSFPSVPRAAWAALAALGLAGCNALKDTDTDVTVVEDKCPGETETTTNAGLTVTQLTIDGIDYFPAFTTTAKYDDIPAACVRSDGAGGTLTFGNGDGTKMGALSIEADHVANYSLSETTGILTLDLSGTPSPVVYSRGTDWSSGTLTITSVTPAVAGDLSGIADTKGHIVNATMSFSIGK